MCYMYVFLFFAIMFSTIASAQQDIHVRVSNGNDFMSLFGSVLLIGLLTIGIGSVIAMGYFKFRKFSSSKKSKKQNKKQSSHPHNSVPLVPLVPLGIPMFSLDTHDQCDLVIQKLAQENKTIKSQLGELQISCTLGMEKLKVTHDQTIKDLNTVHIQKIEEMKQFHVQEMALETDKIKANHHQEIDQLNQSHTQQIDELNRAHTLELDNQKRQYESTITNLEQQTQPCGLMQDPTCIQKVNDYDMLKEFYDNIKALHEESERLLTQMHHIGKFNDMPETKSIEKQYGIYFNTANKITDLILKVKLSC